MNLGRLPYPVENPVYGNRARRWLQVISPAGANKNAGRVTRSPTTGTRAFLFCRYTWR